MAIPIFTDSLDGIPEPIREHYKKQDDGYVLEATAANGFAIENVAGLKSALSAARAEAKEAASKMAAFIGDDGEMIDPASAKQAIERLASLGNEADSESKVRAAVQAQIDALGKKHAQELSARDERVSGLTGQISKYILDDALLRALTDTSDGRTAAISPKVLASAMRDRLQVTETDGQFEVHVLDEQGHRRISPASGSDSWMTVQELVDEGRSGDLKPFFKAAPIAGTGSLEGRTGEAGGPAASPASNLNPTERLRAYYESQGG